MFAAQHFKCFGLGISLFVFQSASANLVLDPGSYANRTQIDTYTQTANLNFVYYGCEENPDPGKVRLTAGKNCKAASEFFGGPTDPRKPLIGNVGEIVADYPESKQCSTKYTKRLHTNYSLAHLYNDFEKMGCNPSYLVIQDGTKNYKNWPIQEVQNKRICKLPDTVIHKKGFPTDIDSPKFTMKANDTGFKLGDTTEYWYDYDKREWCVQFTPKPKDKPCGAYPSPLPIAYHDTADNKIHVIGTVSLSPNGEAKIRAIDKVFDNAQAMKDANKRGELTKTDISKGRIDFQTWRKPNGLARSIVRSYDNDGPRANHQRSINFFARNVFGTAVTHFWCKDEHCFTTAKADKIKDNKCKLNPEVEMTNGGSGNLCHSCVGILPGHCAIGQTADNIEVKLVQSALLQDENFTIQDTGEYKLGQQVERGLVNNFSRMVENPKNPGCHPGYFPPYEDVFDPGEAFRDGFTGRAVNIDDGSL